MLTAFCDSLLLLWGLLMNRDGLNVLHKKFCLLVDQVTAQVLLVWILTQETWKWTSTDLNQKRFITGTRGADFSYQHLLEKQTLPWVCDSCCNFLYSWSEKHSQCNAVMKCSGTHVGIYYDKVVKTVRCLLTAKVVPGLLLSTNVKPISLYTIYCLPFSF